ncbi:MAG: UDP-N-acetylmuramate--alanine ligase [Deltaproteobacteria bacterium]|nr:UDP-N-acetylmuramate--alanine ligase [Deltaproteobacteria bacterium]
MVNHYFFVGIGGSGMSGLAQILKTQKNFVSGSDRIYDREENQEVFHSLQRQGIVLHPQDGSGVIPPLDEVIISAAIEDNNPDLRKARNLSLPVTYRSSLLARLFNAARGIGVAGTSGKSTITAMAAKVMDDAGLDPTVLNGAIIPDYKKGGGLGNAKVGTSAYILVETDESDDSIVDFFPEISIVANISKDHKPLPELTGSFLRFAKNTKQTTILNADCQHLRKLMTQIPPRKIVSFGLNKDCQVKAEEVKQKASGSTFRINNTLFSLQVPGEHNISNALATIALGVTLKIPLEKIRDSLAMFTGIARRLELIDSVGGIRVFDDFSHNPAKIAAAVEALRPLRGRLIIIYQPHGYGPTKFLRHELIETFNTRLRAKDILILLDIYYSGGTVDNSVSAGDLKKEINVPRTEHLHDRKEVVRRAINFSKPGDAIVVMGARDNTLTTLARAIAETLKTTLPSRGGVEPSRIPFRPSDKTNAGRREGI